MPRTHSLFFSDHGDSLCGRWMATKHTSFYEETTHVPLAFAGAGVPKAKHNITGLCSLLDLVPTLCDYAGITPPESMEGRSLWPDITQGHDRSALHDAVFAQWHPEWGYTIEPGRMVRTERYKYTHYLEGNGKELYDLLLDPGETHNRINDPGYAHILKEHRARLVLYITETDDPYKTMAYLAEPQYRSNKPSYRGNDTGLLACDVKP